MSRERSNYCFTLHNYTEDDEILLLKSSFNTPHTKELGANYQKGDVRPFITYICYGKEVCPTTGRPHLQGYFEMGKAKTFSALTKKLPKGIHLELAKGNADENKAYCSKENEFIEYGKPKEQGKRTDLEGIKNEILEGRKVDDIAINNPTIFHQYGRTLSRIEDIALRKKYRNWMTTCDWYYGPTGVGKSHTAFEGFNPDTHYVWKDDNGWQDGYTGQETVIINEFRGNIAYSTLLQMIDKWPFELRRRGREPVPFLAKHIIITSSLCPEQVYNNLSREDKLDQLYRRIKCYTRKNVNENWNENGNDDDDDDDL